MKILIMRARKRAQWVEAYTLQEGGLSYNPLKPYSLLTTANSDSRVVPEDY